MLALTMNRLHYPAGSIRFSPAFYFRVKRDWLIEGPVEFIVGKHASGSWKVGIRFFTVCDIQGEHHIHFTDGAGKDSPRYGPFSATQVADDQITAPGLSTQFVDDGKEWRVVTSMPIRFNH